MKGIQCAYCKRSLQRREVVRRRSGYKAHDNSYNSLRGAELGWQADKYIRGLIYEALKLESDRGIIITRTDAWVGGLF